MKIVRFRDPKNFIHWGKLNDKIITKLKYEPYNNIIETSKTYDIEDVKLLAPCTPSKIVGLALCFKESYPDGKYPEEPVMFLKGNNALIGPNDTIHYPKDIEMAWIEAELAIIIKKTTKNISLEEADNYILGYSIGNDITAKNIRDLDHHLARSKSCDTFSPVGPHIETEIDTSDIKFHSWLNGKMIQESTTANRIFSDGEAVSIISKLITLYPGDVILTGTPPGGPLGSIMKVGIIKPGDNIKIEFDGIGILENDVA